MQGVNRGCPDTGSSGADAWVVRVWVWLLGAHCAADEACVRSGLGQSGRVWIAGGGRGKANLIRAWYRSKNVDVWQGAMPHSEAG